MDRRQKPPIFSRETLVPIGLAATIFISAMAVVAYVTALRSDVTYLQKEQAVLSSRQNQSDLNSSNMSDRMGRVETKLDAINKGIDEIKKNLSEINVNR